LTIAQPTLPFNKPGFSLKKFFAALQTFETALPAKTKEYKLQAKKMKFCPKFVFFKKGVLFLSSKLFFVSIFPQTFWIFPSHKILWQSINFKI
jgi:hypothetical protein